MLSVFNVCSITACTRVYALIGADRRVYAPIGAQCECSFSRKFAADFQLLKIRRGIRITTAARASNWVTFM